MGMSNSANGWPALQASWHAGDWLVAAHRRRTIMIQVAAARDSWGVAG
jgi:hypothetical protein